MVRITEILVSMLFSIVAYSAVAKDKPFKRAVILSGFTINTPLHMGILKGLEDEGRPADVMITCCGGSIAGGIANALPTMEERIAFVRSRQFYEMLHHLKVADPNLAQLGMRILNIRKVVRWNEGLKKANSTQKWRYLPKQLFSDPLVEVGSEFDLFNILQQPIRNDTIAWIPVASRIELPVGDDKTFSLEQPARTKLETEVFFTDSVTAQRLVGVKSAPGTMYPYSPINAETDVVTGTTISQALQAAIAEPVLMVPANINGRYYLGGPVDMDPVGVARFVANEVVGRYTSPLDSIVFSPALEAAYGYPPNDYRARILNGNEADYWVDLSDDTFPNMSPTAKGQLSANPLRWFKFGFQVPDTYEEYLKLADAQIAHGEQRAREALRHPHDQ